MRNVLVCFALAAWSGSAAAETVYVTDTLRLGIHEAPDTSGKAFDNLVSGTAVEVLERNLNYARVRLPDGRDGWVKAAFLVADKPAAARLRELEGEVGRAERAAADAKTAQAAAQLELSSLRSELQATTGSAETIQETIARLERDNAAQIERLEAYRHTLPIVWVIPALVVCLVGGFFVGLWWLDALIRRRHGGFRVY